MTGKLKISEWFFEVPLDYCNESKQTIQIFARSVVSREDSMSGLDDACNSPQKPWLLWLQGGPGKGCHPPQDQPQTAGFLERGYQVLYMDQRGTGLSTAVSAASLALQGDAAQQAQYLTHFRADNIVRDAEAIRKILTHEYPLSLQKWTIWGQSFGGYCATTYLSLFPEGLKAAFITGGVPALGKSIDDALGAIFKRSTERNKTYYKRYPQDNMAIHKLAAYIQSQNPGIHLPAGGILTVQRMLTFGSTFGSEGQLDKVHRLVLRMSAELQQFGFFTRATLSVIEGMDPTCDDTIIHAILREAIYSSGGTTNWAALRVGGLLESWSWLHGDGLFSSGVNPSSGEPSAEITTPQAPLFFAPSVIFPFMFDTWSELTSLKVVAEILAQHSWPLLYDDAQLARNTVPVYVAALVDDAYIAIDWVHDSVEKIGNCKVWTVSGMNHGAIRYRTKEVLKAMWDLQDDIVD